MSAKYLGETFDIHGGGMDLKFPHHECEIAQAVGATGKQPVRYWLHSNMLTVNGQKMSKSLGNSFLPEELISGNHPLLDRGFSPMTVRFFMLQSHYSSTLDFSNEALVAAEKGYKKLANALTIARNLFASDQATSDPAIEANLSTLAESLHHNMGDDFNTATTLATLFEMSARINDFKNGNLQIDSIGKPAFENFRRTYIAFMEDVLGLTEEAEHNHELIAGVINVLIDLRKKARQDRDYALSDKIRDDLKQIGVQLMDGKDGEMNFTID
jgi:cysteinyl-tRNA synthetase